MTAEDVREGAELLANLESAGIRLWLDGSQLRYRAPVGLMTAERLEALRARRDEITTILRSAETPVRARHDQAGRFEPFPLTDVQAAYVAGRARGFPYGGVGCHGYGELLFGEVEPARLAAAWQALIRRHDMLRAVISADGTQQVRPEVPDYPLAVEQLGQVTEEQFTAAVQATRAAMDHRVYQPGEWPLFDLRLTAADGRAILHFSIDFLVADFVSLQILLEELEAEYRAPGTVGADLEITFRDLELASRAARSGPAIERDRAYWRDRLDELPEAPELPASAGDPAAAPPRFRRLLTVLPAAAWEQFTDRARTAGLTPSSAVLAAYAEVLRCWSRRPDFTLNVTILRRPASHPQVGDVVGDFTAVDLLAVLAGERAPFRQRASELQATLWDGLDHGLCSGIEVMRELRKRRADGLRIFPVVFTSSLGLRQGRSDSGALDRLVHGISQTPQVWLDCQAAQSAQGLAVNWDLREGIFADGVPEAMFGAFEDLLTRLAADEAAWDSPSPVAVPAPQLAKRPPGAAGHAPPSGLLHDRFLDRAAQHPDQPALVAGPRTMTYGELATAAAAVARALAEQGCPPGSLVAIEMDKGWEQVAGVLGTLMHGCAYVPVDTIQPASRRDRILADVGPAAILTQSWLADRPRQPGPVPLAVDTLPVSTRPAAPAARAERGPADLAYVIYTSGSTGTPKGVMISHRAALNTIEDVNRRFGVAAGDRVLGVANLGFDLSVYDIFGLLSAGGCLVLPQASRRADAGHWAELIETHQVTIWNSVPAQLEMLVALLRSGPAPALSSLRLGLLSGDWIPLSLPDAARDRLPGLRLVSLGGATEASIWSIWHPIDQVDRNLASIPYGRPLAGQTVQVLGADLAEVPDLVIGEIYIGGAGLSDGYLGDAASTDARFRRHPRTGERLYRPGDLGRYLPDGSIEFLGREDSQVKIRGHRVELAEIEAVLAAHPAVAEAAVVTTGQRPGPIGLAAFVEPAGDPDRAQVPATRLSEAAVAGAAALRAEVDDEEMLAFARELDATALLQMLATFRASGLFTDPDQSYALAEILTGARVAPRHHRLVRRWLAALADNGLISRDLAEGSYRAVPGAQADADAVQAAWRRVSARLPGVELRTDLITYFQTTASQLPELLSGEVDPLTLLFPQARTEIHEVAYNAMFLSRYLNRLLTGTACYLAGQRAEPEDDPQPLRVLEVGAGVGGTSAELIPALAGYDVEYLFTDVSEFFLNNARRRYAQYPWVDYGRYDMNKDFWAQGLAPQEFDLVVCANVLHYARDVESAVGSLRQLLKPGGWLLFIEATRDSYQIMTSMEFLFDEASGEFEDVRRLDDQTFVSREQWLEVLTRAGADDQFCLPESDPITDEMGMHFFAARFKSGQARLSRQQLSRYLSGQLPDHMLPARLQLVDTLPLTSNGKVDRKLLASRVAAGQAGPSAAGGEQPVGDLEKRIGAVWERLLRAERIGRQQTFFELGGDSLLAAQLAAETRESVPEAAVVFYDDLLRLILENATVTAMAELIERAAPAGGSLAAQAGPGDRDGAGSPVVRLGDGPGLTVLVPDGTGTLAAYQALREALAGRTALAGLIAIDRAEYLATGSKTLIDVIAAGYTEALIQAGCQRPRLVGHGFGGIVAAEVARQLAEAGTPVGSLLVIAAAPAPAAAADDWLAECLFWRELGLGAEAEARRSCSPAERFRQLAELAPGVPLEAAREVFQHSSQAAAVHELLPYAGDITLVRPQPSPWWPSLRADLASYWTECCLGDLEIVDLACPDTGCVRTAATDLANLVTRDHAR